MTSVKIVPTCVPHSADEVAKCARAIADFAPGIHIDVDDAVFASPFTWPYTAPGVFADVDLEEAKDITAEVHLMVQEPQDIGVAFARAGAHSIIAHVEAFENTEAARQAIAAWRGAGVKEIGLGILMPTRLAILELFVAGCDFVHMMSIAAIGTQGIPYDSRAPARIAEFHTRHPEVPISVDGGVSEDNITLLVRAGATRFGVGSAIAKSDNPKLAYEKLKALAESALQ